MKLELPSFNKHNPAPAFLQRSAPQPKPDPVVELPRRFTADERDILAKAWGRAVLHNMVIAKAQRSEALAKRAAVAKAESDMLAKAVLAKADDMLRKVAQLANETELLAKRLKENEDQPLPAKTAGPHAAWVQ